MDVAVVIPCHNAAPYLEQTIGSVLAQTLPPTEVIVVDDSSDDGSGRIAAELERRTGGRVRVVTCRFENAARARNLGAALASAEAIMFLDADDVIAPDTLDGLVAVLQPGSVAICPWYRLVEQDGSWGEQPASCRPRRPGEDPLDAWLTGWYSPPCSVLWSTRAFRAAGRWEEGNAINDDGDLMMRALLWGVPLRVSARGAGYYRRPPADRTSMTSARSSPRGLELRLWTISKVGDQLDELGAARHHRRALRVAAQQIATEATTAHPDLVAECDAVAWSGAPALLRPSLGRAHRAGRIAASVAGSLPAPRRRAGVATGGPQRLDGFDASPTANRCDGAGAREDHVPAVSVIIPTFNRCAQLPAAIDSVLGQTFGDFELLVVDDASTDTTSDVVECYRDQRIRLLRQPSNRGVAAARNRGLREARAELVAFLDSDDEWLPDKLELQIARFDELPDRVGLLYGGVETHDGLGGISVELPTHRGALHDQLLARNVIHGGGSNVMIRRRVVAAVGFFDEELPAIEDHDYWLRIARRFEVDFVDVPVMRYHDPTGIVRRSLDPPSNHAAREAFYRKHRKRMRSAGVAHEYLLDSARRHLQAPHPDRSAARRFALRAVARAPRSSSPYRVLARSVVPDTLRRKLLRSGPARGGAVRVLLYSPTPASDGGGVQEACRSLVEGLRREGHDVWQWWGEPDHGAGAPQGPGRLDLPERDRVVGSVTSVMCTLRASARLAVALRRIRPDVVNVHFLRPEALHFLWLRPLFGYRLVLSAHGTDVLQPSGRLSAVWARRAVRRADAVTAVSEHLSEALADHAGLRRERITVIPNGIDVDRWSNARHRPDPDAPVVVAVGRLSQVKGHDVLLESFRDVRERVTRARLVIVGHGEWRAHLDGIVEREGLADAVEFTGQLGADQVRRRLAGATVSVLPSRSEGMPMALLEAMAAGVPVVATAVGAVPDVLTPAAGVVVPPGDAAALADALSDLLADPTLARQMGEQAHARSLEFTSAATQRAYRDLYTRVVTTARGPLR